MPLLASVEDASDEIRDALAALTPPVVTVEALLERDSEALARDTGLALGAVAAFRRAAAARALGPARWFAAAAAPPPGPAASTGCAALDALLGGGGWRCAEVGEVEGPTASGKTQLLLATAAAAARAGRRVAWVDAGGASFHAGRFRELCPGGLGRVAVCACGDAHATLRALDRLPATAPGDVVVVDAPARVLAPDLGGANNPLGRALVAEVAAALNRVARERNVAVVVANATARARAGDADGGGAAFGQAWRGALWSAWVAAAQTRLSLAAPGAPARRRAALARHPRVRPDPRRHVVFRVAAAGLVEDARPP